MQQKVHFTRDPDGRWYIDLPKWLGSRDDLEMVQGADTMLTAIAENKQEIFLEISDQEFTGANVLQFRRPETECGGGWYHLDLFEGKRCDIEMWLCGVTEFVFKGSLPEKIFVKRA